MLDDYKKQGFLLFKDFFSETEIENLETVLVKFHERWKSENKKFYETQAVNSAYLTGTKTFG